jgi:GDP-4-dehydro-6-deoxy-D-mannose reductase
MRIFVTGGTGFAGSHLIDDLLAAGHDVSALVHPATAHQPLPAFSTPIAGDLLDYDSLCHAIKTTQPEVIYHLAGQANPNMSWQKPAFTFQINTGGTANVLQAALQAGRPRVVVVTSADIYGVISEDQLPVTEQTEILPRHPYGISKVAAGELVRVYAERYDLPVVEARPFNHIGPRQALGFVVPDFASQIAGIFLKKASPKMWVGNLDANRDFTDVRDVTRAYRLLAEKGEAGEGYLICSGQPVSIRTILTVLMEIAGISVDIEYDPNRMRPSDTPTMYGSYQKLHDHTGWSPKIHLRQSLADTLAEWMERLQEGVVV